MDNDQQDQGLPQDLQQGTGTANGLQDHHTYSNRHPAYVEGEDAQEPADVGLGQQHGGSLQSDEQEAVCEDQLAQDLDLVAEELQHRQVEHLSVDDQQDQAEYADNHHSQDGQRQGQQHKREDEQEFVGQHEAAEQPASQQDDDWGRGEDHQELLDEDSAGVLADGEGGRVHGGEVAGDEEEVIWDDSGDGEGEDSGAEHEQQHEQLGNYDGQVTAEEAAGLGEAANAADAADAVGAENGEAGQPAEVNITAATAAADAAGTDTLPADKQQRKRKHSPIKFTSLPAPALEDVKPRKSGKHSKDGSGSHGAGEDKVQSRSKDSKVQSKDSKVQSRSKDSKDKKHSSRTDKERGVGTDRHGDNGTDRNAGDGKPSNATDSKAGRGTDEGKGKASSQRGSKPAERDRSPSRERGNKDSSRKSARSSSGREPHGADRKRSRDSDKDRSEKHSSRANADARKHEDRSPKRRAMSPRRQPTLTVQEVKRALQARHANSHSPTRRPSAAAPRVEQGRVQEARMPQARDRHAVDVLHMQQRGRSPPRFNPGYGPASVQRTAAASPPRLVGRPYRQDMDVSPPRLRHRDDDLYRHYNDVDPRRPPLDSARHPAPMLRELREPARELRELREPMRGGTPERRMAMAYRVQLSPPRHVMGEPRPLPLHLRHLPPHDPAYPPAGSVHAARVAMGMRGRSVSPQRSVLLPRGYDNRDERVPQGPIPISHSMRDVSHRPYDLPMPMAAARLVRGPPGYEQLAPDMMSRPPRSQLRGEPLPERAPPMYRDGIRREHSPGGYAGNHSMLAREESRGARDGYRMVSDEPAVRSYQTPAESAARYRDAEVQDGRSRPSPETMRYRDVHDQRAPYASAGLSSRGAHTVPGYAGAPTGFSGRAAASVAPAGYRQVDSLDRADDRREGMDRDASFDRRGPDLGAAPFRQRDAPMRVAAMLRKGAEVSPRHGPSRRAPSPVVTASRSAGPVPRRADDYPAASVHPVERDTGFSRDQGRDRDGVRFPSASSRGVDTSRGREVREPMREPPRQGSRQPSSDLAARRDGPPRTQPDVQGGGGYERAPHGVNGSGHRDAGVMAGSRMATQQPSQADRGATARDVPSRQQLTGRSSWEGVREGRGGQPVDLQADGMRYAAPQGAVVRNSVPGGMQGTQPQQPGMKDTSRQSDPAAGAPAGSAAPEPPLPDETASVWFYLDPNRVQQGPCSVVQFKQWIATMKERPELHASLQQFENSLTWSKAHPCKQPLHAWLQLYAAARK